ncbi:MAG: RNA polymerase sigma factor RpoE [Oceanococcaceae bacterium]
MSTQPDVDAMLVERAQAGDPRAFDALVLKYQHRILQLVTRFVSEADAPDVTQEAFLRAWRAIGKFRGQSAFFTWLYRIAINTAKNWLVSRARRPAGQDMDIQDAEDYGISEQLREQDTPEHIALSGEINERIALALETLPDDLRTAITLREFEGLSYEEIAQAMDCPIGTVRSRIFRARAAIDEHIAPLLD